MTLVACSMLVAACQSGIQVASSGDGNDCTSHYDWLAEAPNLHDLEAKLRDHVLPSVRDIRTQAVSKEGKRVVDLLSAKRRRVLQIELWRRPDGSWVAANWLQCIDS